MQQRVSLVTLGVADVAQARSFYERLGWVASSQSTDDVVFFGVAGMVLGLWDREQLAEDSGVEDSPGWGGITLAHNVASPAAVDRVISEAKAAGAEVRREPAETLWGGYSGVFLDLDGHPWEVAHNPAWPIGDDGAVLLPE